MNISEEAVTAGAIALDQHWGGRYAPNEVEELSDEIRVILEAAVPHLVNVIESLILTPAESTTPHCVEEYNSGLLNACLAIRGDLPK